MTIKLPGKRYRKGKSVFIWHLANDPKFSVSIAAKYWSPKIWAWRRFRRLSLAMVYAKKLTDELGNGQSIVEVHGSMTYHRVNLETGEVA
jgi:hypothetical protein